ncbi:MAG: MFS transporter [Candidatus Bathyarchaeota archaeon]
MSFLADVSSEMIMPILPMFIVALGGEAFIVGLIGGLSSSIQSILQVFSGYLSDKAGKRKQFIFTGYLTSSIVKLFLPLSTVWHHLLVLTPLERVGKGLRTAPRDALIAASTSEDVRGKAFGIHRAMDTGGAVLGASLSFILFWVLGFEFRVILMMAALIAFFALIPLIPVRDVKIRPVKLRSLSLSLKGLPRNFMFYLIIVTLYSLGNFTYMFFILKAQEAFAKTFPLRYSQAFPILLYILFNLVYALFSTPSGILSDKLGRRRILFLGYILFSLTCLGFMFAQSLPLFIAFFSLYGLAYAFIEANQRAYASNLLPEELRGAGLGVFHTLTGFVALPASLIAGLLWQVNPELTFMYGAIISLIASSLMGAWKVKLEKFS